MTMPDERTRAILYAREFLLKLSSPYFKDGFKKIPAVIRQEARMILRHFPNWIDLMYVEQMIDTETARQYGERQERQVENERV